MVFGNVTSRNNKKHPYNNYGASVSQRFHHHRGGGGGILTNSNISSSNTYRSIRNTYRSQADTRKCSYLRTTYRLIVVAVALLGTLYFTTIVKYLQRTTILTSLGNIHDSSRNNDNLPPVDTVKQANIVNSVPIDTYANELPVNHVDEHGIVDEGERHPNYIEEDKENVNDAINQPLINKEDNNAVTVLKGKLPRREKGSKNDDDTSEIPDIKPGLSAQNDPILKTPIEPIDTSLDNAVSEKAVGDLPKTIPPKPFAFTTIEEFERHRATSELAMKKNNDATILRKVITAYVEAPLHDVVPNTGSRGNFSDPLDKGTPPEFIVPLPLRTHTPKDLLKFEYPSVQTCYDMPGKFPIDRGLQYDDSGELVVWNVGNEPTPLNFPELEAEHCPVELDPFLPWIHDVFPSQDGSRIEFIAQNKRRCRTGKEFTENVNRLTPQVALLQSVTVETISDNQAQGMAPKLWHPIATNGNNPTETDDKEDDTPRYRLVPYELAPPNGKYTRFICRFHLTTAMDGAASVTVVLGETLSEYPFNYEYINFRKDFEALLTPRGKDSVLFWTSNLHFSCPVPNNSALRNAIANGRTVLSDGTPTVHVDVVPIRTSVRYDEVHLPKDMIGPMEKVGMPIFNPVERWGYNHVLPRVEASGRWANIPICLPPELVDEQVVHTDTEIDSFETSQVTRKLVPNINDLPVKPHFLVGCLWASAEFKTRGKNRGASTDTIDRLKEWIEFHLMVGFDHMYVYDNSGAHTNETSLEKTLSLFPGKVTRIDWPSTVCNNNIPAHDSTGERSSQYAAENSCRTRFGPFTEWLASFDTDEYFVPMGNYTSLKDVLRDLGEKGTNILSLRSSRGLLRTDHSVVAGQYNDTFEKSSEATFLEAYNCDGAGSPKPMWAERARKQIYRPEYVLYHFVHYSTVTKGLLQTYKDTTDNGKTWYSRYREHSPSEMTSDELSQVVMVHTKTISRDATVGYDSTCKHNRAKEWHTCWVAYPWPSTPTENKFDQDGMEYNCYINQRVEDFWIPQLKEAISKRKKVTNTKT